MYFYFFCNLRLTQQLRTKSNKNNFFLYFLSTRLSIYYYETSLGDIQNILTKLCLIKT